MQNGVVNPPSFFIPMRLAVGWPAAVGITDGPASLALAVSTGALVQIAVPGRVTSGRRLEMRIDGRRRRFPCRGPRRLP